LGRRKKLEERRGGKETRDFFSFLLCFRGGKGGESLKGRRGGILRIDYSVTERKGGKKRGDGKKERGRKEGNSGIFAAEMSARSSGPIPGKGVKRRRKESVQTTVQPRILE